VYKAVFIDVDGTLIRSDHSISNATVDTIQKLKEKNILVVLVSARPLSGIVTIAEKIGLLNNPLVSLNGSYISIEGSIVFNSIIKNVATNSVHEQLQKYNSTIIYYQQTQWFSEFKNNNTDYEQEITSVPVKIQSFKNTLQYWHNNNTGANKILVITPEGVINKIQDDLKQ
jgi:hydroxymethylpyrimidine pyrophosphatase-like HAD family hydrolase